MIKNLQYHLFVAVILSITIPSQILSSGDSRDNVALNDLLKVLPAENAINQTLIMNAILQSEDDSLIEICSLLNSADTSKVLSAQYALNGLSYHVSKNEKQRKRFIKIISEALNLDQTVVQKTFLLTQLSRCASAESIPVLIPFLTHEQLCEPATHVMLAIGGKKAGRALLQYLPNVSERNKVAVIKTLAELRYQPSAQVIMTYVNNSALKEVSLFALANMAYLPAQPLFREAIAEDSRFVPCYLLYAKRIYESGDAETCTLICRDILSDSTQTYEDSHRLSALNLMVEVNGPNAVDDLFGMVQKGSKKVRMAVLNLAEKYKNSDLTKKWLELIQTSEPEVQADIILMLGRQGTDTVLPLLRDKLKTPSVMRIAAITAVTDILQEKAVPDLIKTLYQSNNEEELILIKQKLLTIPDQALLPTITDQFELLPPSSKTIIIEIFDERNAKYTLPLLMQQLNSLNGSVRIASLKALQKFAGKEQLSLLIEHFQKSETPSEQTTTRNTISAVFQSMEDKEDGFNTLLTAYDHSAISEKAILLGIFKKVGSQPALNVVLSELKNVQLQEVAVRTLIDWPNETALEALINIAQNHGNVTYRILAIQGALRIIREHTINEVRAIEYCQQLMEVADRLVEKRMILAVLADIRSFQALTYAGQFVNDDSLDYEAAMAIMKIAKSNEDADVNLKPEQVALALIAANASDHLLEEIKNNPLVDTSGNNNQKNDNSIVQSPDSLYDSLLFNGQDLSGWQIVGNDKNIWQVENGVLYTDGGGGGWISTAQEFADFVLELDFRVPPGGNSGVFLRSPHEGDPAYTGMEIQVLDDYAPEYVNLKPWQYTGSIYDIKAPEIRASKRADEWQKMEIRCKGPQVRVTLNDKQIIDTNLIDFMYKESSHPGIKRRKGYIGLQNHSTKIEYRNIHLTELQDSE